MSKVSANLPTAVAGGQPGSQRHPMVGSQASPRQSRPGMMSPSATAAGGMHLGMTAESPSAGGSATQPSPSTGAAQQNMANPKEKTPMCLLNELARYNKLVPLYELMDETGPAHEKTFVVCLTLGQQKYEAKGSSIKKAQHKAAEQALQTCGLPKPKPRAPRPPKVGIPSPQATEALTSTVKLNSLAMKHGVPVEYNILDHGNFPNSSPGPRYPYYNQQQQQHQQQQQQQQHQSHQGYNRPQGPPSQQHDGMQNQQNMPPSGGPGGMYHGGRGPRYPGPFRTAYVKVSIGNREFIGEGRTRKDARQDAATKALKSFDEDPLPPRQENVNGKVDEVDAGIVKKEVGNDDDVVKSDISLVYETAHNHSLGVTFKVTEEQGPPHMKNFKVQAIVGEFVTIGEGNSKKNAKRKAAEAMMASLRTLTPVMKPERPRGRYPVVKKKKNKSLIQTRASNPEYGAPGLNPISRLVQILQAKKEKEPIFSVTEERGVVERSGRQVLRRREFTMQVVAGPYTCTGKGSNKKNAKRAAAEEMLNIMGYNTVPTPGNPNAPNKSALKNQGQNDDGSDRKVTFVDDPLKKKGEKDEPIIPGTKLAPGLLPMMPGVTGPGAYQNKQGLNRAPGGPLMGQKQTGIPPVTAEIARELLRMGRSPTADNISKTSGKMLDIKLNRPKQQLEYLAHVQGLVVQFTDFPKQGNKAEYLSLVSVSTDPQLVSHGAGPTMEASHDVAAITALRSLAGFNQDDQDQQQAVIKQQGGGRTQKVGNKKR